MQNAPWRWLHELELDKSSWIYDILWKFGRNKTQRWQLTRNFLNVPAVLNVDNTIVDLETIEALYENVSAENKLQFMNLCVFYAQIV